MQEINQREQDEEEEHEEKWRWMISNWKSGLEERLRFMEPKEGKTKIKQDDEDKKQASGSVEKSKVAWRKHKNSEWQDNKDKKENERIHGCWRETYK